MFPSVIVAQSVSSTLINGTIACPGEIVFTCETRGSPIIAWSSEEYVAPGNVQLAFAGQVNEVGDTRNSTSIQGTVATLTNNMLDENGTRILVSILRIVATTDSPMASVNCIHIGDNSINTTSFKVIGM